MVVALSYILAVILTAALAIVLYPISAAFWLLGCLGKVSEHLFSFTRRTIRALWRDIRGTDQEISGAGAQSKPTWICTCGCENTGKFCSECGKGKPEETAEEETKEQV